MSVVIIVVSVISSVGGTSILYSIRNCLSRNMIGRFKQVMKRRKLRKTIENLNYNDFKSVIYEIKTLDIRYEMNGYTKAQKVFFFGDNILDNKNIFFIKYDMNYDYDNKIQEYIDEQIEKSVSKRFALDL